MSGIPVAGPAEWLPQTVRNALVATFGSMGLDAIVLEPAEERGRMSCTARLLIQDPRGGYRTVFAKWPSRHAKIRRLARYSGAYLREAMFYRELASSCTVRLPRIYTCEYQSASDDFVLLLEDLTGMRAGDNQQSSADDVHQVLCGIAPLHAHWIDDEVLAAIPWLPGWDRPGVRRYIQLELRRLARAAAGNRLGRYSVRPVLPLLSALDEELDAFLSAAAADRQTLVHGDLHVDQAFFPAGEENVIVDWQFVQRGGIGIDLARLIVLSLSVPDRRDNEFDLIEAYRTAFVRSGGQPYDRTVLLNEYRRGIVWTAFVNSVFGVPGPGTSQPVSCEDGHDILFDRIAAAAADHDAARAS